MSATECACVLGLDIVKNLTIRFDINSLGHDSIRYQSILCGDRTWLQFVGSVELRLF